MGGEVLIPEEQLYMNFMSLGGAMEALAVMSTGDAWTEMLAMLRGPDLNSTQRFVVTLYITVFAALSQVLLVNLFVMTICEAFEVVGDTTRIEAEKYIPVFQSAWQKVDPKAKGVIEPSQLVDLISSLPQPLGCLNATPFEVEIMCRHITDDDDAFDY